MSEPRKIIIDTDPGQDDAAAASAVEGGVIDAGRQDAVIAEGPCGVDQA